MKKLIACLSAFILLLTFSACSAPKAPQSTSDSTQSSETESLTSSVESTAAPETTSAGTQNGTEMFTARDKEIGYNEDECTVITLNGDTPTVSGKGAAVSGTTVTIAEEGSYLISGTLKNGQILVDADKTAKVQLILNGAEIHSSSSAPLYIKQADKVFVTLASDTENTLAADGEFVAIDDSNIDAAVFSKEDLTLNGSGSLTVDSTCGHGIVSKDDLVITSGSYAVTASGHGMTGKDSVRIADGALAIISGKDCVHAENTDDASLGFIYIAGGSFDLTAGTDGLDAGATLEVQGGSFNITSGGGSANASVQSGGKMNLDWGAWEQTETATEDTTASAKGIKSTGDLLIGTGTFTIDSSDDALHSNANLTIEGGDLTIASGDDGIHADTRASILGGTLNITKSYEGIEGQSVTIGGGTVTLIASDDGLNAAGGNDQSGLGGRPGMGAFTADSDCFIEISGGELIIDASGDGIDSNGNLTMSGGSVFLWGPENDGNGAFDYAGEAIITGGTMVSSGTSGMAQNFGNNSTQGSMLVNLQGSQNAGTQVTLKDGSGNELVSFTPAKQFNSVLISSPQIKTGNSYTLTVGASSQEIEMNGLIYGSGQGMSGDRSGGGMPGGRMQGTKPSENFPTTDETAGDQTI